MIIQCTSILENFSRNKKYLILGKWGTNAHFLNNNNFQIAEYHWDDRDKLYKDYEYLNLFNEKVICYLTKILNNIHNLDYSEKYWNRILGYWLINFSAVAFDRYEMLKKSQNFSKHLVLETFENNDLKDLALNDTNEFTSSIYLDDLNLKLYTEISSNLKNIRIDYNLKKKFRISRNKSPSSLRNNFINFVYRLFPISLKRVVLSRSQIPLDYSIQLSLKLKNIFLPLTFPKTPNIDNYDEEKRKWSLDNLLTTNEFEEIFFKILPKFLPRIFLEGYSQCNLVKESFENKYNLNRKPEIIFSCNSQFRDDIYKFWMSEKCENGSTLINYQHGSGCIGKFNQSYDYDKKISDLYLIPSLQPETPNKKVVNVGRYNFRLKVRNKFIKNSRVMVALMDIPKYSYTLAAHHISSQVQYYMHDQLNFYSNLNDNLKDKTFIRLYPKANHWNIKTDFIKKFPKIKFDKINNFHDSLKKTSLFIGTYNATTYNETLLANIPTVIFWDEKFSEIAEKDKKIFNNLKDVGIFHDNPKKAARHVNEVYKNLKEWWFDPLLQKNIKIFCKHYSGDSKKIFVEKFSKIVKYSKKDISKLI